MRRVCCDCAREIGHTCPHCSDTQHKTSRTIYGRLRCGACCKFFDDVHATGGFCDSCLAKRLAAIIRPKKVAEKINAWEYHPGRMEKSLMKVATAVLALLLFIPTARADSVITVTVTDVTFGGYIGAPEVLNISYVEDLTTGAVSDYEFSMVGPLGNFTGPSGALGGNMNWMDSQGDLLQFEIDDCPAQSPPWPNLGSYPGVALFDLICNSAACDNLFGGSYNEPTGSISVTDGVPEPSTWMLLLAGLMALLTLHVPSTQRIRHAGRD